MIAATPSRPLSDGSGAASLSLVDRAAANCGPLLGERLGAKEMGLVRKIR
jgi:hypothetical protein